MRTKSRGSIVTHDFMGHSIRYRASDDAYVSGGSVPRSYTSGKLEIITYDDSRRPKTDKTTRSCDHLTYEVEGKKIQEYYTRPELSGFYLDSLSGISSPELSYLVAPDVSAYHAEALEFFKSGCVDQEIDLGANLFEFKQVLKLLPDLKTTLQKLDRALTTQSVKHTAKNAANLHLTYSFGIAPLISDVSSFVNSVKNLHNHIEWLRKNNGKPTRVRFSKDLSSLCPEPRTLFNTTQEIGYNITTEYRVFYKAYAVVCYDVSALSDLELQLRYFVRQLGLDKPLSTAWELTPWSFMIDWVFNVGQWLSRVQPAITIPTKFLDLGYTVKMHQKDKFLLHRKYPAHGDLGRQEASTTRTLFTRRRGLPISFSSIVEGDLRLRQLALSMSLALQKWR